MKISLNPEIKNKFVYYLYYGMRVLVALAIVAFTLSGDWVSVFNASLILGLMLLPRLVKMQYKIYLPLVLEVAIVGFIFLSLFLGSLGNYYERFPLWDGVLHFQSGILLGVVGFVVVYLLNARKTSKFRMSPGFVSFFAVCFSMALSVVWEVYEYAVDSWFGYTMQESGLPDTMGDLIVNGSGAIIVGLLSYFWMKRTENLPFAPEKFDNYTIN